MDIRGGDMSVKYLITPSLLGSYKWYLSDESIDAREKFLNTLAKIKTETTPSQQKGLDLEYLVEKTCDWQNTDWINLLQMKCQKLKSLGIYTFGDATKFIQDNPEYFRCIESMGNIVKNGLWQQSVKKDLKIGNSEFLLYGRADVIKRDTIFDIKFTSNYELGKFQDSSQHLIYLYCSDLPKFSYLISDGKDWWREDYFNHVAIEDKIKSKVSEFLNYLDGDKEAKELYFTKWVSK